MSLAKYKQKRKFNETPEPTGKVHKGGKKLQFVIQKHHATQLHYDLRLEMDGVMKSWAVPKGPSLDPATKRLAMMVEDHPIEYNKFEGVIPEGNYGAGKVIIWDRGWYENDQQEPSWPASPQEGLKKGEVKFILHGEKLHGSFALIKTKAMGENAWLLIKHRDKYASDKDITVEAPNSVVSGKDVEEIGESSSDEPEPDVSDAPKAKMPSDVRPMLAMLAKEPFDDKDWLYEIKWDGYRALLGKDGKKVQLYSRTGQDFSKKYSEVFEAANQIKGDYLIDGEIVAVDDKGKAHFEWLQNWARRPEGSLVYYVFDILWFNGRDLTELPLRDRKVVLQKLIPKSGPIKYSDHILEKGKEFYKLAEKQGLEGIMGKRADSRYQIGRRSRDWLKFKTHMRQEAVIGGFTEPRGSRKYIGALVLGVYDGNDLVYVGHTGGGIPPSQIKQLRELLEKDEIKQSPFINKFKPNAPVHWSKPKLVCEVSFAEWTNDGHMRQPIFVGLREDKKPKAVHREKSIIA